MARNRVIGRDGALPWHIPADLRQFKAVTMGKPIIMGRKTYESIGRPLPGRTNIVITRNTRFHAAGIITAQDIAAAKDLAENIAIQDGVAEIMVIGGGEIYAIALPLADRIYSTEVQINADGDVQFPVIEAKAWRESARIPHSPDGEMPGYDFVVLDRAGIRG
jgi:dihydrofolate reductase